MRLLLKFNLFFLPLMALGLVGIGNVHTHDRMSRILGEARIAPGPPQLSALAIGAHRIHAARCIVVRAVDES